MAKAKKEQVYSWKLETSEEGKALTAKVARMRPEVIKSILKAHDTRHGKKYTFKDLTQAQMGGLLMQALQAGIIKPSVLNA